MKSPFLVSVIMALAGLFLAIDLCPVASAGGGQTPQRKPQQTRQLSLVERVAYQYAIEEVYWRHRIWPKENSGPKPSLDDVVSPEQIEGKVADYLRQSHLLEERQRPIAFDQLQAEMERMATKTKEPAVLRELFAALGNDPFVIAECLARPLLADRLVSERSGHSGVEAFVSNAGALGTSAPTSQIFKLPEISVPADCMDNAWIATGLANVPDARDSHIAVWTGSEMIIWGGYNFSTSRLNSGGRYYPATDSWIVTSTVSAPTARNSHRAVWTGTEMIVWGGQGNNNPRELNTGGRYNPSTDSWTATSTNGSPPARYSHTTVWTGIEMIVWGGANDSSGPLNSGGRYNPTTDRWIATSTTTAPAARWSHKAVWTGSEMIVWGGTEESNYLNTGGRYNPAADTWRPTSLANAPSPRVLHTAVWTGNEMIIWGGGDENNDTNTGGRYDPINDSWVGTSLSSAPSRRGGHSAVWTGSEAIVWGGYSFPPANYWNNGGRYSPASDSWVSTATANAPFPRYSATAVWTGSEMIVWGGVNFDVVPSFFNTGGRYCAQPSAPIVQRVVSRKTHGVAGNFDVNLPLSGIPGLECRTGGTAADYTLVVTFLANVSVNGNPQAAVTSGIGTIGSGGVSDGGRVTMAGNVVTIPLTNVTNAQTIHVMLNGVNGSTNVLIPMRVLIGDVTGNGTVNASDISETKSRLGQVVDPTNFRCDVNANGAINSSDISLVKWSVGTGLP